MIEIDIPSIDPIQHEPKIFLGMTSRQCLCIVPGLGLGVGAFMALYGISSDLAIICLGICVVPAVLMGWYTPYNMKFEQFVKLWWFNNFVANSKRILKTDMEEERKLMTIKERQELEKKQQSKKLADKKKKKEQKLQNEEKEEA
jgi:hypothetical protein